MAPRKTNHPGVQRRGNKIRIWFDWQGERVFEPHPAPSTPSGLAQAARDRAKIVAQIEHGVFDYAAWFPKSKRAQATVAITFFDQSEIWLRRARPSLAKSTISGYVKALNGYWMDELADIPINEITAGKLADVCAEIEDVSGKTFNNSLTPLRAVFESAKKDGVIQINPAEDISKRKHQKPDPDPLTLEEAFMALEWIKTKREHWYGYFALAIGTGMRPSELIALRWRDVDLNTGYIQVSRAYVAQQMKSTKTHETRRVEISSLAKLALAHQRAQTGLYPHNDDLMFRHPATGKIINGDKPPRFVWTDALKATKIRHRSAYNARHTYATAGLMAGAKIGWVSRQLGHSSVQMTLTHYAKWLDGEDKGRELAKLDDVFDARTVGTKTGTNV